MTINPPDFEDPEGQETLEAVAAAPAFNKWMYETVRPYCKGRILEIGSGLGNISQYFIEEGQDIVLSDLRPHYCDYLVQHFEQATPRPDIIRMDLVHSEFDAEYAPYLGSFDTVFALNVVEHIEDHERALANCRKLLRTNGHLVILVPAYQLLYNKLDKALGHFRRYTKRSLSAVFRSQSYTIIHQQYFNLAGMPGWIASGIAQRTTLSVASMKLYNALVPLFRITDALIFRSIGLSVVCVGVKTE